MVIGGIPHPFQGDRRCKFKQYIRNNKLREALSSTSDYIDPYIITIVRLFYFYTGCVILPENKNILPSNERYIQ